MKKIFTWNNFKWLMLFITLVITAEIILMFYQGHWGIGKWTDGSIKTLNASGKVILIGQTQPGPGQWRLKQLLITFIGGGALAFAGTLLQKVTKNNLAEVSILGIGSINIMFIFAYVFIFKEQVFGNGIIGIMLPVVTLSASIIGTLFVWIISRSKKANKNTFVIIGIATQLFFEALSVVFVNPSKIGNSAEGKRIWNTIKNYTMGQVRQGDNGTPFWLIIVAGVIISAVIVGALFIRKKIDIYEINEPMATSLGIKVKRLKIIMFLLVAILAGMEASILGTVALLGIIAPSIARLIFKNKFGSLSIASFIIGGILVMFASFISTSLGTNLPPGILATTIAAPYFIFLILRRV